MLRKIGFLALLLAFSVVNFALAEDIGHIQVKCEPGYNIFLDGTLKGISSADLGGFVIQDVAVGQREIKAVKEGFTPLVKLVTVERDRVVVVEFGVITPNLIIKESGEERNVTLRAEVAFLEIHTLPVECKIECPKIGIPCYQKTMDKWEVEGVPTGNFEITLSALNKTLKHSFEIRKGYRTIITANFLKMEVSSVFAEPVREFPVGFSFVPIQPGTFRMGSDSAKAFEYEKPAHDVKLTQKFYIATTETTQAQWQSVMSSNPSNWKGDDLPVEMVSWHDCMEFCRRLNEREKDNLPTGWMYRLPTEAEWEYCCRAGSTTEFCFGDDEGQLGEYAWFVGNAGGKTHPVKMLKPNAWGIYDMHGNVSEWCLDAFDLEFFGSLAAKQDDPVHLSSENGKMMRGGSLISEAYICRSFDRNVIGAASFKSNSDGFRIVISTVAHKQ